MAALVLLILLNPFSGHLQTVDEVVAHSIANHLDTKMKMAFQAIGGALLKIIKP